MPESPDATPIDIKPRSRDVTDGFRRAPARAMLRAVGLGDEDWVKPQIGIASSWNEVTPCNVSLRRLAEWTKKGVRAAGGVPLHALVIHRCTNVQYQISRRNLFRHRTKACHLSTMIDDSAYLNRYRQT